MLGISRPFGYLQRAPRPFAVPRPPPERWQQFCEVVQTTFMRHVLRLAARLPADLAALVEPLTEHYETLPTSAECGAPSVLTAGRTRCEVRLGALTWPSMAFHGLP